MFRVILPNHVHISTGYVPLGATPSQPQSISPSAKTIFFLSIEVRGFLRLDNKIKMSPFFLPSLFPWPQTQDVIRFLPAFSTHRETRPACHASDSRLLFHACPIEGLFEFLLLEPSHFHLVWTEKCLYQGSCRDGNRWAV